MDEMETKADHQMAVAKLAALFEACLSEEMNACELCGKEFISTGRCMECRAYFDKHGKDCLEGI